MACIALLVAAAGWLAEPAHADGDPASDVLAVQSLFLPQDAAVSATQQTQLAELLRTAQLSGYQLRVALIASPADLGSVTELWRQPQTYAQFLGQELSLVYRGPLLVIMPNGIGLEQPSAPKRALPPGLGTPGAGPGLGTTAISAIRVLAAAAGHPLALPQATSRPGNDGGSAAPWIAFAIGIALIAVAWTGSLRARPLRRHAPASPAGSPRS